MSQSVFWENIIAMLAGADLDDFNVWLGVNVVTSIVATLRIDTIMLLDNEPAEQPRRFGVMACCASVLVLALLALAACRLGPADLR